MLPDFGCPIVASLLCVLSAAPDISSVPPDLTVPAMQKGQPLAGKRVRQVIPEYRTTDVYHAIYLPVDWQPNRQYPVLVEYAGNGPYRDKNGDVSTGRLEDSKLGYGICGPKGFIWVCMPYLNKAGTGNVRSWWGDAPEYDVGPTLDYCKKAVPWICLHHGGDPEAVVLAGFSRGAIACNFIGLHDDAIARLWRAFIPYSHYDGVLDSWVYPGADRPSALQRLRRLAGRPQFICHEWTADARSRTGLPATKAYLESTGVDGAFTFTLTGFRNHNDAWTLRPSPARAALRKWLDDVLHNTADER